MGMIYILIRRDVEPYDSVESYLLKPSILPGNFSENLTQPVDADATAFRCGYSSIDTRSSIFKSDKQSGACLEGGLSRLPMLIRLELCRCEGSLPRHRPKSSCHRTNAAPDRTFVDAERLGKLLIRFPVMGSFGDSHPSPEVERSSPGPGLRHFEPSRSRHRPDGRSHI
jgi:hypothetical protein